MSSKFGRYPSAIIRSKERKKCFAGLSEWSRFGTLPIGILEPSVSKDSLKYCSIVLSRIYCCKDDMRQIVTAPSKNSLSNLVSLLHSSRNLKHCCWCEVGGDPFFKKSCVIFIRCWRHAVRISRLYCSNSRSSNCSP